MDGGNNTGGRFPRIPNEDLSPIASDTDAYALGLTLLNGLGVLRGIYGRVPDNRQADQVITNYCRRLRRSYPLLALSRVQRFERISDSWMVAILFAFMNKSGMRVGTRAIDCAVLSVGFDPARLSAFFNGLYCPTGPGRWFSLDYAYGVFPSRYLLSLVIPARIDAEEAEDLKREVQGLPTAEEHERDEGGTR